MTISILHIHTNHDNMENKTCLECGKVIYGRIDKKFCDDQCRNTFNNRRHASTNQHVRHVHHILRKNRRILQELNPTGKGRTTQNRLIQRGFNFSYHTSTYRTKAGAMYFFCYEYGYLSVEHNFVILVKKKDNQF